MGVMEQVKIAMPPAVPCVFAGVWGPPRRLPLGCRGFPCRMCSQNTEMRRGVRLVWALPFGAIIPQGGRCARAGLPKSQEKSGAGKFFLRGEGAGASKLAKESGEEDSGGEERRALGFPCQQIAACGLFLLSDFGKGKREKLPSSPSCGAPAGALSRRRRVLPLLPLPAGSRASLLQFCLSVFLPFRGGGARSAQGSGWQGLASRSVAVAPKRKGGQKARGQGRLRRVSG